MKKIVFKRLMSLVICVILLFSITANHVNAAEADKIQYLSEKISTAVESGTPPEEVLENLSISEVQVLIDKYKSYGNSEASYFSEEVQNHPEVKIIDDLADEYYDYYMEHGTFPEEVNLDKDYSNQIEADVVISSFASSDYSIFMRDLGYTFTIQQIAAQLVQIGSYIGIGSALAFLDLAALIVGMGLLTFTYVAIAYSAVAVGANNLILRWYTREANNLLNARTTTAAVIAEKEQGTEYWEAYLVDYAGQGGIRVTRAITQTDALVIIAQNSSYRSVFTFDFGHAAYIATVASPIYGFTMDNPHKPEKRFNMYHVHANIAPQTSGNTHIFYIPGN
ncbi:hypothetical protein acsn021_07980 [Anaerocolumna cellulosilytica]|uniref:Uncharacterized protein n=1 Tax=Anaerocolumna cellulosilytica TaxID=433286 RepID=A0A6S6QVY3_9FIRM|nr:hypothetical protein [Anaerocolumna cellulosilytica]MBB5197656.1 hypothetical protein [Anaerocolumna cellulosilytica]BCJ93229.1 hypothetical protein acsn021_07980 [Anaerocolumna cellulosilytica]